jgi:hypothetical protein
VRRNLVIVAITARIVRGRVVGEPVGQGFYQRCAAARPSLIEPIPDNLPHRDDVVAVHLASFEPHADRLLRERIGGSLRAARYRDRPLVVRRDEHDRQLPRAGDVHGLVHVAFGCRAISEHGNGGPRLAAQLECEPSTGRVRGVAANGDRDGKILPRSGKVTTALVSAPILQQLLWRDAAHELCAVLAEARQQNVLVVHGVCEAHTHALLAETRRVRAEPSGALERDGFLIERPGQHHRSIELDERFAIRGECRQIRERLAVGVEAAVELDLETCDDGHDALSALRPSSSVMRSRMMNFCTLPVTVIGNSSTNLM